MKRSLFHKLNNEYVLAAGTALILMVASALALIVLVAAIKFSSEPISENRAPVEVLTVKPMPNINKKKANQNKKRKARQGFKASHLNGQIKIENQIDFEAAVPE